ncbi:1,4-dihydroxy-2-naphthoyl-CoA hydrolase [Sinobacterium caligoides]|uniref:1,4-dihydroxy-2-naphthoyl-CoA hydrolase n=1 Tax=Sinobacterium caligoides TaxID=933926 RepID=A0A3N2DQ38_9GAMM|nr:hotdog fold thioesterase [Sinobacterium caligoides]ROS01936.1 1,4-dihydroxy-2-naphthoyl-CoA hydrolase [Sinobacterium caligoides]
MPLWKSPFTLSEIHQLTEKTLCRLLDIEITEIGEDYLVATMPVDARHHQPMGILHGGASVVLAESVGSIASAMANRPGYYSVGLDVNANHIRAVHSGVVTAKATPVHIGRTTHVWNIAISNEQGKPVCESRLTMSVLKGDN